MAMQLWNYILGDCWLSPRASPSFIAQYNSNTEKINPKFTSLTVRFSTVFLADRVSGSNIEHRLIFYVTSSSDNRSTCKDSIKVRVEFFHRVSCSLSYCWREIVRNGYTFPHFLRSCDVGVLLHDFTLKCDIKFYVSSFEEADYISENWFSLR